MDIKKHFIKATEDYNTFDHTVAAPYVRKSVTVQEKMAGKITVTALGFYELFWNGKKITKGFLAPYISNGDDFLYCDQYEVTLEAGENVIGLMLGNGFLNNPGGYIWNFDQCPFRSAPMTALCLEYRDEKGEQVQVVTDETFRTFPSAILSDDYRFGVCFDARQEIPGWAEPGFDDSGWKPALPAQAPRGELRLCQAAPIVEEKQLRPVAIFPDGEGRYIYDFGESNAGVCRLTVRGRKGQKIQLRHGDLLKDGELYLENVWFVRDFWERDKEIVHLDTYICRGDGEETWTPSFVYHGFRYAEVSGITEEQATEDLLTYVVFHTKLDTMGDFSCSDPVANQIQEMTRRSDVSNFHYFPTDCPQREKNGWTADAALSCEQMLLNFNPDSSYREWMRCICKAQDQQGGIPGIIPTYGWGQLVGPSWDCILAILPYYMYVCRGDIQFVRDAAPAFVRYLDFLLSRRNDKGLVDYGLGDWCPPNCQTKAPRIVTSSIMSMEIADKFAFLLDVLDRPLQRDFARAAADSFRRAIRENLVNFDTMSVAGDCQTSQAMGIYYGVFEEAEIPAAFDRLLEYIHAEDDHFDVGVLGARVIFPVLSRYGCPELAYRMITRPDFPSYGNWIQRGATTLWEDFYPDQVGSTNHHFWGSVSGWFIRDIAGIHLNPTGRNVREAELRPSFPRQLEHASAWHQAPAGRISVSWKRCGEEILLEAEAPREMSVRMILPAGWCFDDGTEERNTGSGSFRIRKRRKIFYE